MHEGWRVVSLNEAVASVTSGASVNGHDRPAVDGEIGVLRTSCVYGSRFFPGANKAVLEDDVHRVRGSVKAKSIIVCRANTADLVGASGFVETDVANIYLSDKLWQLRPAAHVDPRWLAYLLGSKQFHARLWSLATGTSGSMKNISQEDAFALDILLPPLDEQRRIAGVLRTWDEAIERARALVEKLKRRNELRAAALLSGRHASRTQGWKSVALGEVTRELIGRNQADLPRELVMGVNKHLGMVPMKEHVAAKDLARYKTVPPMGFAYNPMRLNIGSLAVNDHGREVLVSPDYVVFEGLPDRAEPRFLDHLRRTSRWRRFLDVAGTGSVRVRIYYDGLAEMPLRLPPIDQQRAIADALDLARREVDLEKERLAALERQKRGLMQKLLTGEWRVAEKTEPLATAT